MNKIIITLALLLGYSVSSVAHAKSSSIDLNQLINIAIEKDASRKEIYANSQATRDVAAASSTLMDPKLKVGFGGLPTDSFKFDEDPMTNISIGLMQQFEGGNRLDLQQRKTEYQAELLLNNMKARELEVARVITNLWLELGYQQKVQLTIEENKRLINSLLSFASSNYSNGRSEAHNILKAELILNKLDDQWFKNQQQQQVLLMRFSEWVDQDWLPVIKENSRTSKQDWGELNQFINTQAYSQEKVVQQLLKHPSIQAIDKGIDIKKKEVELAQEAYSPKYGMEVMYAYRQASGMGGKPASDLVSAYLTLDLPIFTSNRQDRQLSAAQYQQVGLTSKRDAMVYRMLAQFNSLQQEMQNIQDRIQRYKKILHQSQQTIKSVERSYQNGSVQVNELITVMSDDLNFQLEQKRLMVDLDQIYNQQAFLLNSYVINVNMPKLSKD